MTAPKRPTIRDTILKLAADSEVSFGAKDVLVASGGMCTLLAAQIMLGKLAAEQKLDRVSRGFYARPGLFAPNTSTAAGPTTMARGLNDAANRALEEAEAFLSSKEQFPGATTPLPYARLISGRWS